MFFSLELGEEIVLLLPLALVKSLALPVVHAAHGATAAPRVAPKMQQLVEIVAGLAAAHSSGDLLADGRAAIGAVGVVENELHGTGSEHFGKC